jgi:hypothetical protein
MTVETVQTFGFELGTCMVEGDLHARQDEGSVAGCV